MAPKNEADAETSNASQTADEPIHVHSSDPEEVENPINIGDIADKFSTLVPYANFFAFANDCKQKGYNRVVHNANVYRKSDLSEQVIGRARQFRDKFRNESVAWTLEVNPELVYGPNDKIWIEETEEYVNMHIYVHREGEIDIKPYKSVMTHVFGNVDRYIAGFYLYDALDVVRNVEVVVIELPIGNNVLSLTRTQALIQLMACDEAVELFGHEAMDQFIESEEENEDGIDEETVIV